MPKRKQVEGDYRRPGQYIQLHKEVTDSPAYILHLFDWMSLEFY